MRDPETFDIEIQLLLEGVYLKYRADFRDYSVSSMRRRVQLALERMGLPGVAQLQEKVLLDPAAYSELLQYLSVPVTEMFRDPGYYKALREHVLPMLATYPSIKVWIAGCSTGEELYSMAILLHEEGLLERAVLYATDINPRSLKRAEDGIFAVEDLQKYTQNYQRSGGKRSFSDYYQAAYGSAVFDRKLRANVVFADHSLSTDSVFSEVQLVSCRNVLIYFNRTLQERAFGLFHDSLGNRGFLGLGSKETLRFSSHDAAFEPVVPEHKIYRKKVGI